MQHVDTKPDEAHADEKNDGVGSERKIEIELVVQVPHRDQDKYDP